ncbi:hypothetical protein D3C81_1372270 [compost metagenome]
MLCHGIHFRDGLVDLFNAGSLFLAGGSDLGHDVRDAPHAADDLIHSLAGLGNLLAARFHLVDRVTNQDLDFLRGRSRALRQVAYFGGDDRKAAPLFAGAGRFDRGIQCQDIGLESDAVDDADDVDNLARAILDRAHGVHHFRHHYAALHGDFGCGSRQLIGLPRIVGILTHGGCQFLHRAGGLFQ